MEIRNVAIIAHVDHGKTTLVDELLKQSERRNTHELIQERAMDSNDIERERGITILAKNTAIEYKGYRINILDTPGHADFGGEVERIMNMVDAVVLVVDAYEGAMPQTRFVLKKALEAKLKPIVVINKIDRAFARPLEAVNEVLDLFIELNADESQLDFPIVYASGIKGLASFDHEFKDAKNMVPLLDTIIKYVPAPAQEKDLPLQFQPALLDYNDYVGRIGIGKIYQGTIKVNQNVSCMRLDGTIKPFRVQKLFSFLGLNRIEVEEAYAGDIVAIAGLIDINVGETVCEQGKEVALPILHIDEPTVQMTFGTNTSPFAGKEGKFVTASKIEERLYKETQKDVSLRVERLSTKEEWIVSGRGELHLGILIENMRREGFEFQVSRPQVIIQEIEGVKHEPYEFVQVDCPNDVVGTVIEMLGARKGVMGNMISHQNQTRLTYTMPSRGLIGFMTDFMTATKGYGILNHSYLEYRPVEHIDVGNRSTGALVSLLEGMTTAYAIGRLEDRGTMFIEPRASVYEGMIVGVANKEFDLAVNVTQEKQLTNMRSSSKDTTVVLKRPREMSLEACLEFINDDELVEITPKNIRLRKRILRTNERKKFDNYKY
ncbi:translational GTPase TypA [Paracholeplasma manati]|jgi:GTP-binding protein|uniref:Large ribosomal subunit assembly factor BipA n=1 Tax=Paracholeplasma manati TaxID=591373 RepID=A0ABT2Y4N0_9MOLU|nr:translational GTPase TypA [Paracholeplasma manati]MCV2231697.1 translational GTPase TypA [Paracholeplasma manati]MDG0888560.1 translational GTPase TypA [Paracholeplasma manati]MDX9808389.1 translational GTPase TypA [Acholeplasma sp.]